MNRYHSTITKNRDILVKMVCGIFQRSNNKLIFSLQGKNLLQSKQNCIESSTAIGYAIEEYIISQLEDYNYFPDTLSIHRSDGATTRDSYDCSFQSEGINFLVNVKVEKKGAANDAVAAIKQLYKDYCTSVPDMEKSFIVLKIKYRISDRTASDNDQRCVEITDVESYCLEEIALKAEEGGFSQDHRNWSINSNNLNNGRLKISSAFRRTHLLDSANVSYENTRQAISSIFKYNEQMN